MGKALTREDILGADDLTRELVECPEWGGDVWVTEFAGDDRDAWELSMLKDPHLLHKQSGDEPTPDYTRIRAKLCARTICDEHGKRLFTETDVIALGRKNAAALDRCYAVAVRLNKLSKEDVEELVKNSEGVLNVASG